MTECCFGIMIYLGVAVMATWVAWRNDRSSLGSAHLDECIVVGLAWPLVFVLLAGFGIYALVCWALRIEDEEA